jgi:hypothetical protein
MKKRVLLMTCLGFLGFITGALAQKTPSNLMDLVRENSRFAAETMKERGYFNVAGAQSSRGVYTYWWNPQKEECVCILTSDAKYQSILETSPTDCNQNVHAHAEEHKNKGAGLAIGAAAAAIIGAAILSNKSHHHEDNKHYDNHETEAAFEQGYRDGKYHRSYHNPFRDNAHTEAYAKGYEAGVDERTHETSYHSNRGGYRSYFNINNLRGLQIAEVNRELRNRGFEMTDSNILSRGDKYEWWYNRDTRQCHMLYFRNAYLSEISRVNRCN